MDEQLQPSLRRRQGLDNRFLIGMFEWMNSSNHHCDGPPFSPAPDACSDGISREATKTPCNSFLARGRPGRRSRYAVAGSAISPHFQISKAELSTRANSGLNSSMPEISISPFSCSVMLMVKPSSATVTERVSAGTMEYCAFDCGVDMRTMKMVPPSNCDSTDITGTRYKGHPHDKWGRDFSAHCAG